MSDEFGGYGGDLHGFNPYPERKPMTACTTMKRSTGDILYVTPSDFELAIGGIKTATSRKGDRQAQYPIGRVILLMCNVTDACIKVRITNVYLKRLANVRECDAIAIGNYGVEAHRQDYVGIYGEPAADENISIVHFERV